MRSKEVAQTRIWVCGVRAWPNKDQYKVASRQRSGAEALGFTTNVLSAVTIEGGTRAQQTQTTPLQDAAATFADTVQEDAEEILDDFVVRGFGIVTACVEQMLRGHIGIEACL